MPVRGWYPDPDRTPGRFRFWNGIEWTADTTDNPGGPTRRTRVPAILVVVLLLIVVGTIVAVHSRTAPRAQGQGSPSSSRSGWDDSSPTPTASASPTRASSATPSTRPAECDRVADDELGPPPSDGRVHGGKLSFGALTTPWTPAEATSRFPFSRDSQMQRYVLPERLPWQASAQVGVVAFDHYPGRHLAAERMLNCLLTSDFYSSVHVTLTYSRGSELRIGGTAASQLDALLTFSHPLLKTRGSLVRIIVVDTSPATYYFHAVPRERRDLITALDRVTSSLTVS